MVNQCRVANMLLTDDPDIGVVAEVGVGVVSVDHVATTAIVIGIIQKRLRKREVIKKMIVINLKLMKSPGVLVVMQVEDVEEAAVADVVVGDGLDVAIAVKVLAMKNLHQMVKAVMEIRKIVLRVNEEAPDVVAMEVVDPDVTDEDHDVHHHKAPAMKAIEIIVKMAIKMGSIVEVLIVEVLIVEMVIVEIMIVEMVIVEIKIATIRMTGSLVLMVMTKRENVVAADQDVHGIDAHATIMATSVMTKVVTKNLKVKVSRKKKKQSCSHHLHNKFKSKLQTISNSSYIIGEVCINRSVHSLKIRERT